MKHFLHYEEWCEKGIVYINDLLNPLLPGAKLFEELILDFEVSQNDRARREHNFLMQNIPSPWLQDQYPQNLDSFNRIVEALVDTQKVPIDMPMVSFLSGEYFLQTSFLQTRA